jgi:RimJ/RimL family protein N-acetyltransferase
VTLVPVDAEEIASLLAGDAGDRMVAPGWPHENSAAGLGFIHSGGWEFLIVDAEGRIAGECGTKTAPRDGVVEIGYSLAAPSRGRGLGTTAVSELVDWLVARPDVSAIEAEVHETNTPSRRVVERLGFTVTDGPDHGYLRYRRSAALQHPSPGGAGKRSARPWCPAR